MMHSLHISSNILITLKITLPQHSVLFLRPFILAYGLIIYPRFRRVTQNFQSRRPGHHRTSRRQLKHPQIFSVFVLLIFIKVCWILFRRTNSPAVFIVTPSLEGLLSAPDSEPGVGVCFHYAEYMYIYIYIYIIYIYYIYIYI